MSSLVCHSAGLRHIVYHLRQKRIGRWFRGSFVTSLKTVRPSIYLTSHSLTPNEAAGSNVQMS